MPGTVATGKGRGGGARAGKVGVTARRRAAPARSAAVASAVKCRTMLGGGAAVARDARRPVRNNKRPRSGSPSGDSDATVDEGDTRQRRADSRARGGGCSRKSSRPRDSESSDSEDDCGGTVR